MTVSRNEGLHLNEENLETGQRAGQAVLAAKGWDFCAWTNKLGSPCLLANLPHQLAIQLMGNKISTKHAQPDSPCRSLHRSTPKDAAHSLGKWLLRLLEDRYSCFAGDKPC